MWYLIENDLIIDEQSRLPKLFVVDDVQHPLREMASKGHDVTFSGWLPEADVSTPAPAGKKVSGQTKTIVGNTVEVADTFIDMTSGDKVARVHEIVEEIMGNAADPLDAATQIAVTRLQGERGRGQNPTGDRLAVLTDAEADLRGEVIVQTVIAAKAIKKDIEDGVDVPDVDNDSRWPT